MLAAALTALCYCAIAALLAMVTRRPVVIGVLYILLWEGTIATFAASADRFSIAAYGRAIASEGIAGDNAAPSFGGAHRAHRARGGERRRGLAGHAPAHPDRASVTRSAAVQATHRSRPRSLAR